MSKTAKTTKKRPNDSDRPTRPEAQTTDPKQHLGSAVLVRFTVVSSRHRAILPANLCLVIVGPSPVLEKSLVLLLHQQNSNCISIFSHLSDKLTVFGFWTDTGLRLYKSKIAYTRFLLDFVYQFFYISNRFIFDQVILKIIGWHFWDRI